MVPQVAIKMATKRMAKSNCRAPLRRICAETGPIIHMVNALNDPKNAITAENSGMAMETATAAVAVAERLKTLNIYSEVSLYCGAQWTCSQSKL